MRTEMMQRLEDQRAELEDRHSEQIESALAQQRQALMSQADHAKVGHRLHMAHHALIISSI